MTQVNQQPTDSGWDFKGSMNLLLFVCRAFATSAEVFLHRAPGDRYLGWNAAAVLLLVPLFGAFWQGYDVRLLMGFLPAYMVMCIVARVQALQCRRRGERCHSFYTGWPRLMGPKSKLNEIRVKRFDEPLVTLLAGWVIRQADAPLGTYLMICGISLFVTVNLSLTLQQLQALNMHDSVIDQEQVAQRFREMRGQ